MPIAHSQNTVFEIRVTGILIRENRLLLVRQRVSETRPWSLPGGRAEAGETLDAAIAREMREETGLITRVKRLLYVCDMPEPTPPVLHITFALEPVGGTLTLPTNEYDANPISDVRFVPLPDLGAYGFTEVFIRLASDSFPHSGNYMGVKANIGL